jgi:hypothetical protein
MRILLIAAIVLICFAIAATANAGGATFLGVSWTTWLCASFLSVFTDWLLADRAAL